MRSRTAERSGSAALPGPVCLSAVGRGLSVWTYCGLHTSGSLNCTRSVAALLWLWMSLCCASRVANPQTMNCSVKISIYFLTLSDIADVNVRVFRCLNQDIRYSPFNTCRCSVRAAPVWTRASGVDARERARCVIAASRRPRCCPNLRFRCYGRSQRRVTVMWEILGMNACV